MDDLISRKAAIESIKDPVVKGFALYALKNVPSVPAVPLDKLCEWLDYHAGKPLDCVGEQCVKCKFGVADSVDGNCWKAMLTKWMERLEDG